MSLRRLSGDPARAQHWCAQLGQSLGASSAGQPRLLLLLAGTDTAAVPGISAAGSTPAARQRTAAAGKTSDWKKAIVTLKEGDKIVLPPAGSDSKWRSGNDRGTPKQGGLLPAPPRRGMR